MTTFGLFVDENNRVVRRVNLDRVTPSTEPDFTTDTIPEHPDEPRGKIGVLYLQNESLVWELEDRNLTESERLEDVEVRVGFVQDWVQPQGAHDAIPLNAVRRHNDSLWRSLHSANVWEPVEGALWEWLGPAAPQPADWVDQLRDLRPNVGADAQAIIDALTGDA